MTKQITTHLPEDLIMEAHRLQEKLGLSRAALIRLALSKLIMEYKNERQHD